MRSHSTTPFQLVLACLALAACAHGERRDEQADPNMLLEMAAPSAGVPLAVALGTTAVPTAQPSGMSACATPVGRVLDVGPGKTYAVPSQAARAAQAGDTIRIATGDYIGDVAVWYAPNLRICGVGGRARLYANGKSAQGKAIWVMAGDNAVIENVDFHDCKVVDRNGAGIRVEPKISLTVRDSGFYDNENGILSGNGGSILIERAEFARNGYGDGYSHNLYVGRADSLIVRSSFFHEAKIGHNLKSRAKSSLVENSYFMDGPAGMSSYLNDFPNGGVVTLRGNMYYKGPRADNSVAISFGAEGLTVWPTNTLGLGHNTVVSAYAGGSFISARPATQALWINGNLFAGTNNPALISGGLSSTSSVIYAFRNFVTTANNFPNAANVAAPSFWPLNSLLASVQVGSVINANYLYDSPKPYLLRPILSTTRLIGALQAAP